MLLGHIFSQSRPYFDKTFWNRRLKTFSDVCKMFSVFKKFFQNFFKHLWPSNTPCSQAKSASSSSFNAIKWSHLLTTALQMNMKFSKSSEESVETLMNFELSWLTIFIEFVNAHWQLHPWWCCTMLRKWQTHFACLYVRHLFETNHIQFIVSS